MFSCLFYLIRIVFMWYFCDLYWVFSLLFVWQ